MSDAPRVYGTGACSPIGLTAPTSFAALNAGIRRFVELEGVLDAAGQPARGSRLTGLELEDPLMRATWFARRAIREALRPVEQPLGTSIPLIVAAPALGSPAAAESLMSTLAEAAPAHVSLGWGPASIVMQGRAGGVKALGSAIVALRSSALVLVGGLDSLVAGAALDRLVSANRLLGTHNCDGRLPGEGAAFVLLGRHRALGLAPERGIIVATTHALDPTPFTSQAPSQARGLTQVFATLRSAWPARVDQLVSAQSNERHWANELSVAYLRNVELMPEPMRVRELSAILGDCGAAAFPLGLALALDDLSPRRWRRSDVSSTLVFSSSDSGLVGGAVVRRPC